MKRAQLTFNLTDELIVDNFAGGGGASQGIEEALARAVDIAINHDPDALAMHRANHPETHHIPEDVWRVNPLAVTGGRRVGVAWFSPDCKDFSKAKGGKPVSKKIRGLAWIMVKWAALKRPRVMFLENVEEFQDWGPLLPDNTRCPKRKGKTFRSFLARLRSLGYAVEHRELRACDYGAPTIRKRLFLIARCDGKPIVWPKPTHGKPGTRDVERGKLKPWRTAAECIDFSLPCPSIFLTKSQAKQWGVKRPLADATMRRIARGIMKFVINNPRPFIVKVNHTGDQFRGQSNPAGAAHAMGLVEATLAPIITEHANASSERSMPADEPMRTQCAQVKGGHFAIAAATLVQTGYGEREGQKPRVPVDEPMHTVTSGGNHIAEVRAFLVKYYGTGGQDQSLDAPMHTIRTRDSIGLVMVEGEEYVITDIGMRMLEPRELFMAQGFPPDYVIDVGQDGKRLPKHAQVRMCGNSVPPPMSRCLVAANVPELSLRRSRRAA